MEEAFQKVSTNKDRIYMDMIHTVKLVFKGDGNPDDYYVLYERSY